MKQEPPLSLSAEVWSLGLAFLFTGAGFALPFVLYPGSYAEAIGRAPEVYNLFSIVAWMGLAHFVFAYWGHERAVRRQGWAPLYWLIFFLSVAGLAFLWHLLGPKIFSALAWIYFLSHLLKSEMYYSGEGDWRAFAFPLTAFSFFSFALLAPDHWAGPLGLFSGAALAFLPLVYRPVRALVRQRFFQPHFLMATFLIGEALVWGRYRPNMTPEFRDGVYTVHVAIASFFHYFRSYAHMLERGQGGGWPAIVAVNVGVALAGLATVFYAGNTPLFFLFGPAFFTIWVWLHQWMSDVFNWRKARATRPANSPA